MDGRKRKKDAVKKTGMALDLMMLNADTDRAGKLQPPERGREMLLIAENESRTH